MELYCRKNNIVSQFFRFAPWMNNQSVLEGACKKILLKKIVYLTPCIILLSSLERESNNKAAAPDNTTNTIKNSYKL